VKKLIISFTAILISSVLFSQDQPRFSLDEVSISLNRTFVENNNTDGRFGFGAGIYHLFLEEKSLNVLIGLEYNYTVQYKKFGLVSHFSYSEDLTYHINSLSFPIGLRVNFGKKTRFFIESGGYADFTLYSTLKGTSYSYYPDSLYHVNYIVQHFNEQAGLNNSYGIYMGLGVSIPLSKFEILIKSDYKFGLNNVDINYEEFYNRYIRLLIGLGFD
jgi:hypothetical protein